MKVAMLFYFITGLIAISVGLTWKVTTTVDTVVPGWAVVLSLGFGWLLFAAGLYFGYSPQDREPGG